MQSAQKKALGFLLLAVGTVMLLVLLRQLMSGGTAAPPDTTTTTTQPTGDGGDGSGGGDGGGDGSGGGDGGGGSPSSYPDGLAENEVVICQTTGAIYVLQNGLKRHVPSMAVFNALALSTPTPEDCGTLNSIPDGADVTAPGGSTTTTTTSTYPDGLSEGETVICQTTGAIYVLQNGQKRHVPSMAVFNALALSTPTPEDCGTLNTIPDGADMTAPTSTGTGSSTRTYTVSSGNDISAGSDLFQLNNTTASACETQCDATSGCAAFVFNGSTCWGKSGTTLVPTSGVDAYIAGAASGNGGVDGNITPNDPTTGYPAGLVDGDYVDYGNGTYYLLSGGQKHAVLPMYVTAAIRNASHHFSILLFGNITTGAELTTPPPAPQ